MTKLLYKTLALALLLPLILPGSVVGQKKPKGEKTICITFDELPYAQSFQELDVNKLHDQILSALKKHEVKAAGFVVGYRIENHFDIIGRWLNEGHRIGNMTFSNQDYNDLETDAFLTDVVAGGDQLETMLSGFGQKPRYFRYPFLHYGDTPSKKAAALSFLEEYDISVVHATVVVEDYLYNLTVEKSHGDLDSASYDQILNEYFNHLFDELERVEQLSVDRLGRHCSQILQLRTNQLNALFLDELLTALKEAGYKFITLDQALKDEVYTLPEAYFQLRGVGYLDMLNLSDPDYLPAQ
ncbi:MAG: polysaccharide deacetylase family protein [bacterium]|nr:polysaccharide deacetylase family protein [bacterium]